MAQVIQSVQTPVNGIREISDLTSVSGVASVETTVISINSDAVVKQLENAGVPVSKIRGDGRVWVPLQSSTPGSLVQGDVWLEDDVSYGIVLKYYDGTSVNTLSTSMVGSHLTFTAATALLQGRALYASSTGAQYANNTVDAAEQYKVLGLAAADTLITDPVSVLTIGDTMTLADWSLVTPSVTLTPGATYWLSSTPGKFDTTPDSVVASKIGVAVTTTTLLIQPDLIVIL